jgi:SIR2-like domain
VTTALAPLQIPAELIARVKSRQAVPFVGAGFSAAAGIVGWDELVTRLRSRVSDWIGREVTADELDTLETPLLYSHMARSRQPLYDVLEQAVGEGFRPTELHRLLAQMPVSSILTTNWDRLIEEGLENEGRPRNVIHSSKGVAGWNEARAVQIIKMHGSIDEFDSIVFGEDDYQRLYTSDSLMLVLARTLLATRSVFAVGFSMRDSYVKMLFAQVARLAEGSSNPHYVVVPETDESELRVQYLNAVGFRVITVPTSVEDPFGTASFMRHLHAHTYSYARDRIARTRLIIRETRALKDYIGADRTIRVRATMGPLACPPDLAPDLQQEMFGSEERYDVERELRELCIELAQERGVKIRVIATPRAADFITDKGWSYEAYTARLDALIAAANELGERLELVEPVRPTDANDWTVADLAMLQSRKKDPENQRLYDSAELETDRDRIRRVIRDFDEEFETLVDRAGGLAATRIALLKTRPPAAGE